MENFTDLFGDDLGGLDGLGDLGSFGSNTANPAAPGGAPQQPQAPQQQQPPPGPTAAEGPPNALPGDPSSMEKPNPYSTPQYPGGNMNNFGNQADYGQYRGMTPTRYDFT